MQPDFAAKQLKLNVVFLGAGAHEAAKSFHAKLGNPGPLQGGGASWSFTFEPDWVEPYEGFRLVVDAVSAADGPEARLTRRVALQGVDGVAFAVSDDAAADEARLAELRELTDRDPPIARIEPGFGNEWAPVRDLVTAIRARLGQAPPSA